MKVEAEGSSGSEYVGFWARFAAFVIDSLLVTAILAPILIVAFGGMRAEPQGAAQALARFLITMVLPAVAVVVFWVYRSATPGKMMVGARIVDARSGARPATGQLVARYLAYYVSILGLCLGFLWIAFDKRKQGWHDKIARTVVERSARR